MNDDLLARELGKTAKLAAKMGGALAGVEQLPGTGPLPGVRALARFLPTETCSEQIHLDRPAEQVLRFGFSILSELGELQDECAEEIPHPSVMAVVKGGFLNANSSLIYFEILSQTSSSCVVRVTAAAKEGLIKQRTAQKLVQAVVRSVHKIECRPSANI